MIQEYPLTKANRIRLARAFRDVPRVDIAIECVLEAQMGMAYTDDLENPASYMIRTGPFHYFAGDPTCNGGQEMINGFQPFNLFMSASQGWEDAYKIRYGELFVEIERYKFSSEQLSTVHLQTMCRESIFADEVKRMDAVLLKNINGQIDFVDISDFDSAEDFEIRGIGFCIERNGKVIGAAYSSLVCNEGIEVSLFVEEDHRRQGIATILSASLVLWCLEHQMDAHWDAANLESCVIAEKLGFTPLGKYAAYYLKPGN